MREIIEFRIPEDLARQYLPDDLGVTLGNIARKIELSPQDPMFAEIGRIDRELRAREGMSFFTGWNPLRRYSARELAEARLLHLGFQKVFEPAGEQCGTQYEDASACPSCGAGARQVTSLFMNGRKIPSKADFARTIAGEVIVSDRFVELYRRKRFRGARFEPVRLSNQGGKPSPRWYQLQIVAAPVDVDTRTRIGRHLFDTGEGASDRCPRGDTLGLNVLSEVWIVSTTYDGSDVIRTRQLFGERRGLLRPEPEILVSPRVRTTIEEAGLKGCRFEVAHLA